MYNILKALQSSGTVKTFETSGSTWFETNTDFHGNFVCSNCGKIYDIGIDEKGILGNIEESGYSVQEAALILKGVCKECLLDHD